MLSWVARREAAGDSSKPAALRAGLQLAADALLGGAVVAGQRAQQLAVALPTCSSGLRPRRPLVAVGAAAPAPPGGWRRNGATRRSPSPGCARTAPASPRCRRHWRLAGRRCGQRLRSWVGVSWRMSKLCRSMACVSSGQKSHAKMTGTLAMRGLGTTSMNLIQETMRASPWPCASLPCFTAMFHVKQ